jgi:flagellar biosynthesis protein FlhF
MLVSEVTALRGVIDNLVHETRRNRNPAIPAELFDYHRKLIENNVADELAERLIVAVRGRLTDTQLRDPRAVRSELAREVATLLPPAVPIHVRGAKRPYVIALIGPTGVGKTTTIAKLAANLCLRENRRVGLVTLDTYRIAAIEQLKTYARIIDVPLEVVLSPEQLREAVPAMADRDVVFFDTAGRSQRDDVKIKDLERFFTAVKPQETHLVLSAAADQRVLSQAVARFSEVGFDRVIFTKLDEAVGFGVVLNCLEKVKTQLSYVTTGQDVPDDIRVADNPMLTELILGPAGQDPSISPRK